MSCYPCEGGTFTHKGHQFSFHISQDDDIGAPWEWSDGHGPVRRAANTHDKRAGERVLYQGGCREWSYLYDYQAAVKLALKEGWGVEGGKLPGETKRQYAVRAVEKDMEFLRGWCADEWTYVVLNVYDDKGNDEYLGGIESFGDYWMEARGEMAEEILAQRTARWRNTLQAARAQRSLLRSYQRKELV